MIRIAAASVLLSVTLVPAPIQKRPDFSGTWVEDMTQLKSPYLKQPAGTGPKSLAVQSDPLVITQTSDSITFVESFRGEVSNRLTHTFDGKPNVNRQGAQTLTTRARWNDGKLVVEGDVYQITSAGESEWKIRESHWLTPKGELAIEAVRIDPGGREVTVQRVYRRK